MEVAIYNALGAKIATLYSGYLNAGPHSFKWNATDNNGNVVGSGFYFYRVILDGRTLYTRKILLMK